MKYFAYLRTYFSTAQMELLKTSLQQFCQLLVKVLPQVADDHTFIAIWSVSGLLTEMELSQKSSNCILHDTSCCQLTV